MVSAISINFMNIVLDLLGMTLVSLAAGHNLWRHAIRTLDAALTYFSSSSV